MGRDEANRKGTQVLRRLRTTRWLVLHVGLYVVLNVAFLAVWFLERSRVSQVTQPDFWPGWMMFFFGLSLGVHAAVALVRRTRPDRSRPLVPAAQGERTLATVLFIDILGSSEGAN